MPAWEMLQNTVGFRLFKETQNYVAKVTAYMNENLTIDETNNQISSADFLSALDNNDYDERVQSLLEQIFSYEDYMRFLETVF